MAKIGDQLNGNPGGVHGDGDAVTGPATAVPSVTPNDSPAEPQAAATPAAPAPASTPEPAAPASQTGSASPVPATDSGKPDEPPPKPQWKVSAYKGWIYAKGDTEADAIEVYKRHFGIADDDKQFKPKVEPRK